ARVRLSIGRSELRNHDPFLMLDELSADKNGGFLDHPPPPPPRLRNCHLYARFQTQHKDIRDDWAEVFAMDGRRGGGSCIRGMPVKSQTRAYGSHLWINLPPRIQDVRVPSTRNFWTHRSHAPDPKI
ncbi:MAG: hypothetical protein JOS17DRAFT_681892, partial [Linnemannia elongata]